MIESSDDMIQLIGLKQYIDDAEVFDSLRLSSLFMDLLKIVEYSVHIPVTTVHLLVVLHLAEIREHDTWQRINAAVQLLDMLRESTRCMANPDDKSSSIESSPLGSNRLKLPKRKRLNKIDPITGTSIGPWLHLTELRTLLWYSLGLQEFNDLYYEQIRH